MSYDLLFVRKDPDQSWKDALDAVEDAQDTDERDEPDEAAWGHIAAAAARLLPEPVRNDGPGFVGLVEESTGIEVSLETDSAWITVPYWYRDEDAGHIVGKMYALGAVIEEATGLRGYDPQVGLALAEAAARPDLAVSIFNQTADSFRDRGIWSPANG